MPSKPRSRFRNCILRNLPEEVIERLALVAVPLPATREIEAPGEPIRNIFFIESGVGSMTLHFSDGKEVEVGLFGPESVVGISALMGTKRSMNKIFMQIGGHGYIAKVENARTEFTLGKEFQSLALRYVQAQLNQATISAACNLTHSANQRLARWLLLCSDRMMDDSFTLSHGFLGMMLGARRSTITVSIERLAKLGILTHRRRNLQILDREALIKEACECYGILSKYLNNPSAYEDGFAV